MDSEKIIHVNRTSWEQRLPIHLNSPMYRRNMEILKSGGVTFDPPIDREVGDIAGLRVLHLQCHFGLDTLSLSRLGADVTGLDFSPSAVAAAKEIAEEMNIPARFVVGDAQHADEVLAGEQFDLVFATIGVFCWIGDLQAWMNAAANLLKPGGRLYIADSHPFLNMFEDDPDKPYGVDLKYDYFSREPLCFESGPTYADDGSGQSVSGTVEFMHPMGEFLATIAAAGLTIEYLHEFPGCFFQFSEAMVQQPDGLWDFPPPLQGKLPMVFSISAKR